MTKLVMCLSAYINQKSVTRIIIHGGKVHIYIQYSFSSV